MTSLRWLWLLPLIVALLAGVARADDNARRFSESDGGCNVHGCFPPGGGCNLHGCWANGGGCNLHGCWNSPVGSCNIHGCSDYGACTINGCPMLPRRRWDRRHRRPF